LAEIETDKAVVEMPASGEGVVRKILVAEGVTVPVGKAIAIIGTADEPLPQVAEAPPPAPTPAPAPSAPVGEVRASPLARRLAEELGVDLRTVTGTGPGGRITEVDVRRAAEAAKPPTPPPAPALAEAPAAEEVALSKMRQAIARLTTRAKQETPHFYVTVDVDMTEALALRQQVNKALEAQGIRVSINDMLVRACALALKEFPTFNASYQDGKLRVHKAIHIGIAISLEGDQGLIVPALLDCANKSLADIAKASKDLVERANRGHLTPEEYGGATFSISNLGMYDVDSFIAIIHPPQAAVLAVGSVRPRPVVRDGQVVVRQVMTATLSVDHRVADGAQAGRFLGRIKALLETPFSLLV
ncbi:MAG: dihydrolipoamide acetyltransferase family protein, partial [Dehalococcoidia bacterium]